MILPFFSNLVSPLVSITPAAVAMPDKASPIIPGKDTVVIEDLPPIQEETQPEVKIAPVPPRKPEMQGPPIPQVYGPPAPVDYGPHLPEPVTAEPVVAEQVTPFVSAFDPRAWAQPTADFFEAYTAGTAGSNFLKNYREIQGSRADQEYKRMTANAQLLNALKQTNGLGTVGKEFRDLAAVFGEDRAREMLARSYERGRGGVNISLGDKSMENRTRLTDEKLGNMIFDAAPDNISGSSIGLYRNIVRDALLNGTLNFTGRFGAEPAYKFLQSIGALSPETEQALQALNSYSAFERAANLRKIVGGGQVSNIEQAIAAVALPGLDKTKDQLLMMIRASEGLEAVTDKVYRYMLSEYNKMTPGDQLINGAKELYAKEMKALYDQLGLGSDEKSQTGGKVFEKLVHGRRVKYEEGDDGRFYTVQ